MNQVLMEKLQRYVQQVPISTLKNMTPRILMKALQVSEKDLAIFVSELHKERLLRYKFNIICPSCEDKMTIYETQFLEQKIECINCEEEITLKEAASKGYILYILDKDEILRFNNQAIDFRKVALESKKVYQEVQSKKIISIEERRKKMKIFIGSSSEAQKDMELVARIIESFSHTPVTWTSTGVFTAGEYTLDSLIDTANDVDAAIFIFKADDKTWYRKSEVTAVRDNVLLEYGLFTGKLSRSKVIFACRDNPKIATDLGGVNYLSLEEGEYTLKEKIRVWLEKINK